MHHSQFLTDLKVVFDHIFQLCVRSSLLRVAILILFATIKDLHRSQLASIIQQSLLQVLPSVCICLGIVSAPDHTPGLYAWRGA
jgi:hypothetical protein